MKITRTEVDGVTRIEELDTLMADAQIDAIVTVPAKGAKSLAIYPVQIVVDYLEAEAEGPILEALLPARVKAFAAEINQIGDPLISIDARAEI